MSLRHFAQNAQFVRRYTPTVTGTINFTSAPILQPWVYWRHPLEDGGVLIHVEGTAVVTRPSAVAPVIFRVTAPEPIDYANERDVWGHMTGFTFAGNNAHVGLINADTANNEPQVSGWLANQTSGPCAFSFSYIVPA